MPKAQQAVAQAPLVQQQPAQILSQPAQVVQVSASHHKSISSNNVQTPQGNVRYIRLPQEQLEVPIILDQYHQKVQQ